MFRSRNVDVTLFGPTLDLFDDFLGRVFFRASLPFTLAPHVSRSNQTMIDDLGNFNILRLSASNPRNEDFLSKTSCTDF